jgi:hypothetical protein
MDKVYLTQGPKVFGLIWTDAAFYAFYAFYAWWDYFPQSGALAGGFRPENFSARWPRKRRDGFFD